MEMISTGIDGLDEVLQGGIPKADSFLIEGAPGTGKTTLGLQLIYNGITRNNRPGLIISFEQFPEQIYRDAASFGWDLRRLEAEGRLATVITSPSTLKKGVETPEGFIRHEIKRIGVATILIDSITHLETLSNNPIELRGLFNSLINGLKREGLTTIITKEIPSSGIAGLYFEEFSVDSSMRLYYEPESPLGMVRSLEVFKTRGHDHIPGRHAFRVTPEGIKVFPALQPKPRILEEPTWMEIERISTGIAGLDRMLEGGLIRSTSTIVAGAAGTGMTTLGLQFLMEGSRGREPGLLVSFEESPQKILMFASSYGMEDIGGLIKEGTFFLIHKSLTTLSVDELLWEIRECIQTKGIRRAVVDGLTDICTNITDKNRLQDYVYSMINLFGENRITSIFTHSIPGIVRGPQLIQSEFSLIMDNVITLRYKEAQGQMQRLISVLKMRGSSHEKAIKPYKTGNRGIEIE